WLCHQSSDVPLPHLAARRARGSAHRRLSNSGWGSAENGDIWICPFCLAVLPGCGHAPARTVLDDVSVCRRHHLRRVGLADAERYEEAGGLLLCQPPGFLHAGDFCCDAARPEWIGAPTDQPWNLDRRIVLDCRHPL